MAHITTVAPAAAGGKLRAIYDAAVARAGKVYQILQVQSLNPDSLQASMGLYLATTTSPRSSLPRWLREAIATLVSATNRCRYWTLAHAANLRAELRIDPAWGDETPDETRNEALVASLAQGATAAVPPPWRALLDYTVKLTRAPASCTAADVAALRAAGLSDVQISDGVQVAAYFNYINRIAEGLGVDLEPEMRGDA